MSNEKLADLLRDCLSDYSHPNFTDRRGMADRIRAALQAHAAEAAQAQAQSSEWVMVPREPTKAMIEASCKIKLGRLEALRDGHGASSGVASAVREEWDAMLATAPQQAAEPLAWPFVESPGEIADRLKGALENGCPLLGAVRQVFIENPPLYTHPQPAQDASKYQELLMAVSKKFPNESRHETALRYIKQTELQSCEPKCDAAMVKESGDE